MNGRSARRSSGTLRFSGAAGLLWGATLLWRGRSLFAALEHREPTRGEQDAITVLGARHLAQGVVQVLVPGHFGPLYAGIDGIHAASMVVLAVRDPQRRRAVLLSAAVAAVSGLSAARATAVRRRNR